MEIILIKAAYSPQALNVENGEHAMLQVNQSVRTKPLESAIGVDRRHTSRIGKLFLGERKVKTALCDQTDSFQSQVNLAQDMSDRFEGVTASDVDDPLAKDRFVDESHPPQTLRERRPLSGNAIELLAVQMGDPASRQRGNAVIHFLQHGNVQVAEVAGDQKRGDLTRAIRHDFVSRRPSFKNEMNLIGSIAVVDDVTPGLHFSHIFRAQRPNHSPILRGQVDHSFQLSDERVTVMEHF